MTLPALIFDFGNVIAFFDFEKTTAKLGGKLGMSGRELLNHLATVGFTEQLQDYERGQLTAVQFSTRIAESLRLTITHDEFVAAWADIFTPNQSIVPLIEALKAQGYPLILGSNTNDIHTAQFRQQLASVLAHFDRLVLSYEVGHIKPAREFFLACAEAAHRPSSECIFIDDLSENIQGARAAGLVGIVYESTEQLINDLQSKGVEFKR